MAVEHPFKPLFKSDLNSALWTELFNTYIDTKYQDGGRGPDKFDCWGLLRDILLKAGASENSVPSYGKCSADNKLQMTQHYSNIKHLYPQANTANIAMIAGAFSGSLLVHIGLVVPDGSQLAILHTTQKFGVHKTPIHLFERQYSKVNYYHADHLLF
jgi:hypothetical protein